MKILFLNIFKYLLIPFYIDMEMEQMEMESTNGKPKPVFMQ